MARNVTGLGCSSVAKTGPENLKVGILHDLPDPARIPALLLAAFQQPSALGFCSHHWCSIMPLSRHLSHPPWATTEHLHYEKTKLLWKQTLTCEHSQLNLQRLKCCILSHAMGSINRKQDGKWYSRLLLGAVWTLETRYTAVQRKTTSYFILPSPPPS